MSPLRSPSNPLRIPNTRMPDPTEARAAARMAAFMPDASPPLVSTPMLCIALVSLLAGSGINLPPRRPWPSNDQESRDGYGDWRQEEGTVQHQAEC